MTQAKCIAALSAIESPLPGGRNFSTSPVRATSICGPSEAYPVGLLAHVGFSMNVSLTATQLRQMAVVLAEARQPDAARRAQAALEKHLAGTVK